MIAIVTAQRFVNQKQFTVQTLKNLNLGKQNVIPKCKHMNFKIINIEYFMLATK